MQLEDGYRSISIHIFLNFSAVCTSDFGRIEHLKILLNDGGTKDQGHKNKSAFILQIYFLHDEYI